MRDMAAQSGASRPTLVDRLFQAAYWLAFRAALLLWFLRRPAQDGYLAVIRHGGRALLIRNSYHSLWSAPGGSAKPGESPAEAAARETREEIGVSLPPGDLMLALDVEHVFRFRRDRVRMFACEMAESPEVAIDHREVVEAAWFTPAEALNLQLIPHLRDYFQLLVRQDRHDEERAPRGTAISEH
jgi:8-oxo-dGTP pyrophosphatase MutT (NUDIX family)